MAWFKLCSDDELVDTLIEVFNATIVRVPEARIQPLTVVANRKDQANFRGALLPLLVESTAESLSISILDSRMANLSGKRSRRVTMELGLEILDGFLRGFGVPSMTLHQQFDYAVEVSFSFRDVHRRFIDVNELGLALQSQRIAVDNPAASIFFGLQPFDFLLIDSTITSREFTLQIERKQKSDFKLDIPAIQDLIAKAGCQVTVESTTGHDISFTGPHALSFAFTCLRFLLDDDGRIISLPPSEGVTRSFGSPCAVAERVHLSREYAMLEWED